MKIFPGSKVLFTDTDSLCYEVPHADVYQGLKDCHWMDFSNYPKNHLNYSNEKYLKPGFFKDETASIPIKEFIGIMFYYNNIYTKYYL